MGLCSQFAKALLVAFIARAAHAQVTLENSELRLELIGLKRWTVPMIQDSLRRYAPKDSLMSHACAAVLRSTLKFADASVIEYSSTVNGTPTKPYLAVTVIEPEDSALVRYRRPFRNSFPNRPEWATVRTAFDKHNAAVQHAIQRPEFLVTDVRAADLDSVTRTLLPLRRFLQSHRTQRHHQLALRTLSTDGNWRNRVAAIMLLGTFSSSDTTWWALMDALRDPVGMVSATAAQQLSAFSRGAPRSVNWAPATDTLRALIDGTNLFVHNEVLSLLTTTRIDTGLARPLLRGGGDMVLAKLSSHGSNERNAARAFLIQIAGRDLGDDVTVWREWIRSL
jgi:hypothetical protein